ncbi:hypothetical protein [Agrococcus sp. ARC_14]|uniref:hypothetical protein n=1 Tax=Agrococcus sp. ARC_14 TaxID=2919927 RepID=UPI001F066B66|nr:hypothetical protein [Agrococcus sp. ARC_14]MCH1884247.1 hypothetical protein [Agrococcus sp. ARC_14]
MTGERGPEYAARAAALWMLLIGFAGALLTGLSAARWLQGSLRFGCTVAATGGGRAAWTCSDGMALLVPAIATVVLGAFAMAGALLVVTASWQRPSAHAGLLATAGPLAVMPALVLCAALWWDASVADAEGVLAGEGRVALWAEHALPAAITMAVAGVAAAAGLRMRARGLAGRLAGALVVLALALLLVAAVLSSLGTLSTGLIAAGVIGAAWYLAAAAPRTR